MFAQRRFFALMFIQHIAREPLMHCFYFMELGAVSWQEKYGKLATKLSVMVTLKLDAIVAEFDALLEPGPWGLALWVWGDDDRSTFVAMCMWFALSAASTSWSASATFVVSLVS